MSKLQRPRIVCDSFDFDSDVLDGVVLAVFFLTSDFWNAGDGGRAIASDTEQSYTVTVIFRSFKKTTIKFKEQ